MFCEDKSYETLDEVISDVKEYIALQKEYAKWEVIEKITAIGSALLMIFIVVILGLMTLFYLLASLAYVLAPHVGGLPTSFAIIAGIIALLIAITIIFRNVLFVKPLIGFLTQLFFNHKKK